MKNTKKILSVLAIGAALLPLQSFALTKNETVYTKLDYTGSVNKTIVSNHLSYVGSEEVRDETTLKNILNVNGDEKYTLNGNTLTFNGEGKDIFYQGTTDSSLPVSVSIKYYLDGSEVDAKDITGKKGNIKMVLTFKNNDKQDVKVNGKTEIVYTPFVSTVGLLIDGKTSSNVTIDNGKVVSTGTKNLVVGIATPGLYESLNIGELKNLNQLTITYDTTSFKTSSLYIVSTPGLLSEANLSVFDSMDTLTSSVNELQTNMDKIQSGMNQVSSTLDSSVKDLETKIENGVLTSDQVSAIKKQATSSVNAKFTDTYKASLANNAWSEVQSELAKSNDTTITSYVTEEMMSIIKAYLESIGIPETNSSSLANAYLLYTTIDPSKTPTEQQIQAMTAVTNNLSTEQITTLNKFANSAKISAANAASKTTSYIAENVSKSVATSVAQQAATQTASTVAETVATSVATSVAQNSYESLAKLNTYIQTINTGINEFNEKGINKISEYATDLSEYGEKAEALVKLSKNYKGYASSNSNKTTFIYYVK